MLIRNFNMKYRKIFLAVLVFNVLIIVLLAVFSFQFLRGQIQKMEQKNPQIMAQYTISLETARLKELLKEVK